MRTCLSTYLSVHLLYIRICLYIHTHKQNVWTHMYAWRCVWLYVCVQTHRHIRVYAFMRAYRHTYTYVYMHMNMYIYIYMYVYMLATLYTYVCACGWWGENTNQKNIGWTSVDRSTKATLSTYNTQIQLSRLQKIYHLRYRKFSLGTEAFNGSSASHATGSRPNVCHVTSEMVDNTA